jgi:ferric-dicitrate binding protein FerR (iron transport regulator)
MSDTDKHSPTAASAHDALAELIRAAGWRPAPPPEHYSSVLAASRSAWQAKVRSRKRRRWLALAASIVVAGTALAVLQPLQPPERAPLARLALAVGDVTLLSRETGAWEPLSAAQTSVLPGDRLRTGPRAGATFTTQAGHSLRIGAGSEVVFEASDSVQLVVGMLYVDSGVHVPLDAIEIATALGTIRDIGTQFEVRSSAEALRVRVRTGRVAVVDSPFTADFESGAGEEVEFFAAGTLQLRTIAPDDESWNWATALAAPDLENTSILSYLQWIARETGRPLRFDTPNTERRAQFVTWSGDARGLTPIQILESISATSDFLCEVADQDIVVQRR